MLSAYPTEIVNDTLRALAVSLADSFGVPRLGVALVSEDDQELLVNRSDGAAAINDDMRFQAASSGKHVLACVILRFAQQRRLSLHDPIGRFLTDLPRSWSSRTIGSLLHHTSGLPDYLSAGETEPTPQDRASFMARAARLPPMADEGALWSYSNTNYILLGFLAAELDGRPAGRLMQDLLDRTGGGGTVASPDWVRRANAERLGPKARDKASLSRAVIGDGDVAFTVGGAASWLRAMLQGPPGGSDLFVSAALGDATAPYGCGLFVERSGDDAIVHHGGHYDGWTAMMLLNRTRRAGTFVFADVAPGNTRAVRAIAQRMLETYRPGSTPLALGAVADTFPEFTRIVREQLLRGGAPANPVRFARSMRLAIERAGPRGVLDFWAGHEPQAFELVDEYNERGTLMRRYRLTYSERVEHVLVGMTADGLIDWAWPL